MSTLVLIVLARAVHVLGGVIWAGSHFLLTWVIFPVGARHAAQGGASWLDEIRRKAAPMAGISALLTVLSGIYLLMALHPGDASPGGRVLQAGALAAILSFFVGIGLRKRGAIGPILSATLLALAVLAMATFRYVQALG